MKIDCATWPLTMKAMTQHYIHILLNEKKKPKIQPYTIFYISIILSIINVGMIHSTYFSLSHIENFSEILNMAEG